MKVIDKRSIVQGPTTYKEIIAGADSPKEAAKLAFDNCIAAVESLVHDEAMATRYQGESQKARQRFGEQILEELKMLRNN